MIDDFLVVGRIICEWQSVGRLIKIGVRRLQREWMLYAVGSEIPIFEMAEFFEF
jgi:hypothetical protein